MCQACERGVLQFATGLLSRRAVLSGGAGVLASIVAGETARATLPNKATEPAQLILTGANIWTMNDAAPRAEALAVTNGRIAAIGSRRDVERLGDSSTRVVDFGARTVMPGFIDPHMHFSLVGLDDFADTSARRVPTIAALQLLLRQLAGGTEAGGWVRGQQYDPSIMQDRRGPTMAELDAAVPDLPVFILEGNGHIAYANSKAFVLAGITATSADPPLGRFVRDGDGKLSGRIEEASAMLPFVRRMPQPTDAELTARVARLTKKAAAVGCTTLHDCGIGSVLGAAEIERLRTVARQGSPVRLRGMLVSTYADAWDKLGLRPGFGDDLFRVRGMKAWADGSNQARTGFMREPYLGTQSRGALNYTPEQLSSAIRRAHAAGWQVGVHANGDAAIDVTIAAYRQVLADLPRADHRHRIEHCSVLHPEHMTAMAQLGLSPSFLIGHVRVWGKAFRDRILGHERAAFYDPCRSALAAGLRISLHSDFNVTDINPLQMVETAVTRVMEEGGEVFYPGERIDLNQAFKAVTRDAAWQLGEDEHLGSLEVGKFADLVVLDEDPARVPTNQIAKIPVRETWLAGARQAA